MASTTAQRSCAFSRSRLCDNAFPFDTILLVVKPSLLELIASLAEPGDRTVRAAALAGEFGAKTLIVFICDEEVGVFLPGPGFVQTLPNGHAWRAFLSECAKHGSASGTLPFSSASESIPAVGYADDSNVVLVLLGTESPVGDIALLRALLPLLVGVLRGERALALAAMHARSAKDAVARGAVVTATLDRSRRRLEVQANELRSTNVALNEAREAAEAANRTKGDFLATMSHELRTPLNAIGGYVELLSMGIHGPITPAQAEALSRVVRSQRHLLGLINDILNLARIEAGGLRYAMANVALGDAIVDLAPMIDPQIAAKSLHYELRHATSLPKVYADREKLQQILLNLLSNAVKFTPAGGSVWIEVGDATRDVNSGVSGDANLITVSVCDTGQGIPPKKLEWIFEPFTQVDASHSRVGEGAGLGLAISRDLARGMGGDLNATSEVGKGSVFTLTLARAHS